MHQWIVSALVQVMAPSHYLNWCRVIANWTPGNKLQWNFDQDTKLFIHENASENVVWEMATILFRERWIHTRDPAAVDSAAGVICIQSQLGFQQRSLSWFITERSLGHTEDTLSHIRACRKCQGEIIRGVWVRWMVITMGALPEIKDRIRYGRNLTHWGREEMADFSRRYFYINVLEWNVCTSITVLLEYDYEIPIHKLSILVQGMAWRRT